MAKKKLNLQEVIDVFQTAFESSDLIAGEIGVNIRKQFGWTRIQYYGYLLLYLEYTIKLEKMQQDHSHAERRK